MKVLACSADWVTSDGASFCPGTLSSIEADQIPSGMTIEDAQELTGHALYLFAVVFCILAIKKALT